MPKARTISIMPVTNFWTIITLRKRPLFFVSPMPYPHALPCEKLLCFTYGMLPEVEDGRGKGRVGHALGEGVEEVFEPSGSARGYDRHCNCHGDAAREGYVVAVLCAVSVHARKKYLTGAEFHGLFGPLH